VSIRVSDSLPLLRDGVGVVGGYTRTVTEISSHLPVGCPGENTATQEIFPPGAPTRHSDVQHLGLAVGPHLADARLASQSVLRVDVARWLAYKFNLSLPFLTFNHHNNKLEIAPTYQNFKSSPKPTRRRYRKSAPPGPASSHFSSLPSLPSALTALTARLHCPPGCFHSVAPLGHTSWSRSRLLVTPLGHGRASWSHPSGASSWSRLSGASSWSLHPAIPS
jgi:hypothetical protein